MGRIEMETECEGVMSLCSVIRHKVRDKELNPMYLYSETQDGEACFNSAIGSFPVTKLHVEVIGTTIKTHVTPTKPTPDRKQN